MTSPTGTRESKEISILQGEDGALCSKWATVNKVIWESETHHEMIQQQLEVEALENQIAVEKRKQEIEWKRIKEDQERTRTEEQSVWDLVTVISN